MSKPNANDGDGAMPEPQTCSWCNGPAAYIAAHYPGFEVVCERCARQDAAGDRGRADAALSILDATLEALYVAGLRDEEILAAVKDMLNNRRPPLIRDTGMGARWQGGFECDDRYVPLAMDEASGGGC